MSTRRFLLRAGAHCAAALLVAALPFPSRAEELPVVLHCARGVADYPDAEMRLSARGHHVVDVTFVGSRPSRARADWSLRDCLNTASKFDRSRDIVARLWYRARLLRSSREPLQLYGPSRSLVYQASSRTIGVRSADALSRGSSVAGAL